jgi:hypothetical protein
VILDEAGRPIELGRWAMGVTYKALDVDLRRPVTLKVISERYLGDESARLRFLREARAAASVRHQNVASVFHLGRTGRDYFYAMEFVEGETLEHLIKRSRRLETKLALEITTQVAAGLAAVHEQNLVHRDIKPSNIMVRLKDDGGITAKIIDLGLAKAIIELSLQTAVSTPGGFVGTPEFASPEQFAGLALDTRSDLYSLGVTLWEMLTARTPFRGTPGEVMFQHQHAPLPLERLQDVPQPVVVLLEKLLEKDPAQRFQTPNELLKAMPTITGAIKARRGTTRRNLQQMPPPASRVGTRRPPARLGPKKISIARLPVTGSDVFGREEDIAFLDRAWANKDANVVTIVAWAGVGKSTLVNHWLRRMAAEKYRAAELVFGWSFYRQGTGGGTSSAGEFFDAALSWFADPDTRIGTAWQKGERLAKLVDHRRTLLVLDGMEPLQNPPGPQEGRLREPSIQALLRELGAFNTGLCVITTRTPIADIADHEGSSALRRDLEHLSKDAGASLLRALGVKGDEAELQSASDEFRGHCLALTLLGSYLTDACKGNVRRREEVSARLAHDLRQGAHARKVMESYQSWLGEGPELAILRMLGLFDRPVDEQTFGVLLKSPVIPSLTESLTDLRPTEWQTILAKLRRAKLLAREDADNPGQLDTHPLVREYFGEQLRSQRTEAWKECNRRLYHYYRTLAPQLPNSFGEMNPFSQPLSAAAMPVCFERRCVVHFFEHGRWGWLVETAIEGQSLTAEDKLFLLVQAGLHLTATRGMGAPEPRICYERAEPLCHSLSQPGFLSIVVGGQLRYTLMTDKLSATIRIAQRLYSLAQEQNDAGLILGAYSAFAVTFYFLGEFETARQYARRGVQIWRLGGVLPSAEDYFTPVVTCLTYGAVCEWQFGEIASCHAMMDEGISIAKELNDMNSLAMALNFAAFLAYLECDPAEVGRFASELIEISTRHNFMYWLATGQISRGWARSASGGTAKVFRGSSRE